jgi:lysophospholipase L1-like esterase
MELGTSWLWLQFGGNSMPVIKSQSDVDKYALSFRKQIRLFKEILPHVPVLVIGPSDMSKNIDGKWQTWPWLPEMVQALKNASLEEGAIYFNMFQAMGGKNAMPSWVNANPLLAGADYIHFTSKGAEKMAQIILETFFKELEIFELMQEHVEWEKENI